MITLNGYRIVPTIFPDGTSQVWKIPDTYVFNIPCMLVEWFFESEAEFMHLAQLNTILRTMVPDVEKKLYIDYLPYARQDKDVTNGEQTFALHTFSFLLNKLGFDAVTIMDPHSPVAQKLISCMREIYPFEAVYEALKFTESTLVAYPDKGAVEKYSSKYPFFYVYGEKVRDQSTGKIVSLQLRGIDNKATDPKGRDILIVDDLCDRGGTFILLAKSLYDAGAREVNLFVTHGLFTGDPNTLSNAGIKRVFTKNGEVYGK